MSLDVVKFKLYFDGAARNNPGPAGAGIVIKKNNELLYSNGFYLGSKTNNQAEYLAFLLGLFHAKKYLSNSDLIEIISDSELIVRQITGLYKIKNVELQKLSKVAVSFLKSLNYTIGHIPREQNAMADKKANLAIDKKLPVPQEFINFLQSNDISYTF